MQQRVDFITLGVPDLAAARRFYVDGLGWRPTLDVEDEVVFLQVGHGLLLALWGAENLEADVGSGSPGQALPAGAAPIALAHNVASEDEVALVLERAAAAGGTVLKHAQPAAFGGLQGYFADPAGFRWEVAYNPGWSVAPDGRVSIAPIEE
jgi:catechol 2,3-dioxygenase-like lactoylglutathione lyase family enzyme